MNLLTLSPVSPTLSIDAALIIVAILAVVLGIGLLYALKKQMRVIAAAILIALIAFASAEIVLYSEASIDYWFVSADTTTGRDNSLVMYCQNKGLLVGTFDLLIKFRNAHFSLKTSLPYQLVDEKSVKFTFTLKSGEIQNRSAWFIIDENISDFYIDLSFQQNGGNFLVRSQSVGVTSVSYQKETNDSGFYKRYFMPPP